jgi:hypothetical protein
MRHLDQHQSLGASLASVAVLAGVVGLVLGWLAPVPLSEREAPGIQVAGPEAPPVVTVRRLTGTEP